MAGEGEKISCPPASSQLPARVQHNLPPSDKENAEIRELNLAPLHSRISKQLPLDHQPLPSIWRDSQQPGPQAGVSVHCLLTPHAANCRFPGMTDVAAIQHVQARTKAFSRSTKPAGMQTGPTSIEATCQGPFSATPPSTHAHTHTYVHTHLFKISPTWADLESGEFFSNHWAARPEQGGCPAISLTVD